MITHETLPSGFQFADRLQVDAFSETGSINGASKVCFVYDEDGVLRLATRLRPPNNRPTYKADYQHGWTAWKNETGNKADSQGFCDGYRDAAENRMKWHLAYCESHGDHAEGCHA